LASTFMMIKLSDRLWHSVQSAVAAVEYNKFDMDLINDLLGDTVMMLSGMSMKDCLSSPGGFCFLVLIFFRHIRNSEFSLGGLEFA